MPVSADLEDGFGETSEAVATTIEKAISVGAAGGNIEDFTADKRRRLVEQQQAVERIAAAYAAKGAEAFVLVGRTDVLLASGSVDEAIARANAYLWSWD